MEETTEAKVLSFYGPKLDNLLNKLAALPFEDFSGRDELEYRITQLQEMFKKNETTVAP